MTRPRITKLEIQGFRGFGSSRQIMPISSSLVVLWGSNSVGKTSFTEAVEFLLTGQISRRDLTAGAKDEFADSLRNTHLDDGVKTEVAADFLCADGILRRIVRTLVQDYRKGSAAGCVSEVSVDGVVCSDPEMLEQVGLRLSQPPIQAPIISQHTLSYLFSAAPAERAAYFRAILETQDLEDFRVAVASLPPRIPEPTSDMAQLLKLAEGLTSHSEALSRLRKAKTLAATEKSLVALANAGLQSLGRPLSQTVQQASESLSLEIDNRRSAVFPVELLRRSALAVTPLDGASLKIAIEKYLSERARLEVEAVRVIDLFKAAMALHEIEHSEASVDCPLCNTNRGLTPARIAFIRTQLAAADSYQQAERAAEQALDSLAAQLKLLLESIQRASPSFMNLNAKARRERNFGIKQVAKLLGPHQGLPNWIAQSRQLFRAVISTRRLAETAIAETARCRLNLPGMESAAALTASLEIVARAQSLFSDRLAAYAESAQAIGTALIAEIDQGSQLAQWNAVARMASSPEEVAAAIESAARHAARSKSLQRAIVEIEKGVGRVADEKFDLLSKGVRAWWDRLRPDESTFFDQVGRQSERTRRAINLRAGLTTLSDRSDKKVRDAIAVFSQSQLHCLGLALFLARSVQEECGFIVLDEPAISSDDDYTLNFTSSVIEDLIGHGIHTIILTQNHKTFKDITTRWQSINVSAFDIFRDDLKGGTEIRQRDDDLSSLLNRAAINSKSTAPDVRKLAAGYIRDAIELFSKRLIVESKHGAGDSLASVTDYDGIEFGAYSDNVYALLVQDRAHPGKLRTAYNAVTPGAHNDAPPTSGNLKQVLGDLKKLIKDYLTARNA